MAATGAKPLARRRRRGTPGPQRLARQILVRLAPPLALLFVGVLIWLGRTLEKTLLAADLQIARHSSLAVAHAVEAAMLTGKGHQAWERVVTNAPRGEGIEIDIVGLGGAVLFSTDSARRGMVFSIRDPLCTACHGAGASAPRHAVLVRGAPDAAYQIFAAPLLNGEGCRPCHASVPEKLAMVLVRVSTGPVQARVRRLQLALATAGVAAAAVALLLMRALLGRYLGRPLEKLAASARAMGAGHLDQRVHIGGNNELALLAETLNRSQARLGEMLAQLQKQRDDFQSLYGLVDQLSRQVLPSDRRKRAVELASQILGCPCILIRAPSPAAQYPAGVITFPTAEGVTESGLSGEWPGAEVASFYEPVLVERWLRGELDGQERASGGKAVAYLLERGGRRLGLLLRPAAAAEPEPAMMQALAKHLAISLEFSELQRDFIEQQRLAAIGETVAGVAHWAKNVLNGLRAGQYVIERGLEQRDLEKLRKGWGVIQSTIRQVERFTFDVLYCAKERPPERSLADINKLVRETSELMREAAARRGVALEVDLDPEVGVLAVDAGALSRAVLELVSNAIDACIETERGNRVVVRTRAAGAHLILCVEDNGAGIPEGRRRELFRRFYSTKGAQGTGLGLMVVKKIAEEHGGRVEVASEVGRGSRFQIVLPRQSPSG